MDGAHDSVRIREAVLADDMVMDVIARQGDAEADSEYLALVRSQRGLLLVAESDGAVIAYGGVVPVGAPMDALMLTDLFVTTSARGRGIGGQLLAALFGDNQRRMTSSSKHDAALPAYQRAGMVPRQRILYFVGRGSGPAGAALPANEPWRHERAELVDAWSRYGGHVGPDVATVAEDGGLRIARLQSADPIAALHDTLRSIDSAITVRLCVPEHSPVASAVAALGFEVEDNDIWCASPGVELPDDLHVLDPGLG